MDARRQGRVEALRQTFRDRCLGRDGVYVLAPSLECLGVSTVSCVREAFRGKRVEL